MIFQFYQRTFFTGGTFYTKGGGGDGEDGGVGGEVEEK